MSQRGLVVLASEANAILSSLATEPSNIVGEGLTTSSNDHNLTPNEREVRR